MPWWGIVLLVILGLLIGFLVFAFVYGRKMQKKQADAEKQMAAARQTIEVLVVDKKKLRLKEANLPAQVLEQAPKYMRRMKMPIVKVKYGPRMMNMIADAGVFEIIPTKKNCTIEFSGIYITRLKAIRGSSVPKLPEKKGLLAKLKKKAKASK